MFTGLQINPVAALLQFLKGVDTPVIKASNGLEYGAVRPHGLLGELPSLLMIIKAGSRLLLKLCAARSHGHIVLCVSDLRG